jgi:hypothetical protein
VLLDLEHFATRRVSLSGHATAIRYPAFGLLLSPIVAKRGDEV